MQFPDETQRKWALAIGAIAVAVQLTLVWGFEFFPSVDGPAHVHLAHAFYEAWRGDAFYGGLVELNHEINPNVATQGVLVALMTIAPPFVAEKIWLSLYFTAFAAASAYALSGIHRNSLCLLPLLMYCSISFPLAFGFYNFAFSTVIFLCWFGYWWRHRETPGLWVYLGHAALALAAYATHIFAFMVSLAGIGLAASAAIFLHYVRNWTRLGEQPGQRIAPLLSHALPPIVGSIPGLVGSLYFLLARYGSQAAAGAADVSMAGQARLVELLTGTSFAPYDGVEAVPACIFVVATLITLLYFARRGGNFHDSIPLAVCLAGFLLMYLVMPHQFLARWMPARFQPLVFTVLLLWIAALTPPALKASRWKAVAIAGLLPILIAAIFRHQVFKRLDSYYVEFASAAPHIAERSTLIGLRLHPSYQNRPFPAKLDVLIQAGSRIASLRHSVDVKNFQGHAKDHPIQFRAGVSATRALGGDRAITSFPARVRLMEYERESGRPIDYVLVYGSRIEVENRHALALLDAQLEENYRLVHVSRPRGLVQLYERKRHTLPLGVER